MATNNGAIRTFGSLRVTVDLGTNNQIVGELPLGSGAEVRFESLNKQNSNNSIVLAPGAKLNELSIFFRGENCQLTIGAGARLTGRITLAGNGSSCQIGALTTAERIGIVATEGQSVSIGERCMISYSVEVRNSDAHSIIDVQTGKRINRPQSVSIGDHVWLGAHSLICKGVTIPNDVIVGQGSIVTKSVEEPFCVVAGNPARIVRTGTTWDNKLLSFDEG